MGRARLDQVNENIRRELSQLLHQEFEGAVATLLSVTRVEITPDLRLAKIFISALGSEKDINLLVKKLNRSLPFWQGVLAERIMMKFMPRLRFFADDSLLKARRIHDLIDSSPSAS